MEGNLTLKDLTLNIKEKIKSGEDLNVELYVERLSAISGISVDDIRNLYNTFYLALNVDIEFNQRNVPWTSEEEDFIKLYVSLSKTYEEKTQVKMIDDLADMMDGRSRSAIMYRFYVVLSDEKPKKKYKKRNQSKNKSKNNQKTEHNPKKKLEYQNQNDIKSMDSDDLLDIVVEIIDNVEMAGIDVYPLFNSLLVLSRKAVKNADKAELELLKKEKSELREEIKYLTKDMILLKQEFENFGRMDGKDKIRNIQNLTNRVKYIVDGHGNVSVKE